jgi:hypothetical protein
MPISYTVHPIQVSAGASGLVALLAWLEVDPQVENYADHDNACNREAPVLFETAVITSTDTNGSGWHRTKPPPFDNSRIKGRFDLR